MICDSLQHTTNGLNMNWRNEFIILSSQSGQCVTIHEKYGETNGGPIQDGTWRYCLGGHEVSPSYQATAIADTNDFSICQNDLCNGNGALARFNIKTVLSLMFVLFYLIN